MGTDGKVGMLSLIFVLPGLLLVTTGFLGVEEALPEMLFHPLIVMGGLAAALGLSAVRVLRVRFAHEPGAVVGTVSLRIGGTGLPLSAMLLSVVLAGIILGYVFLENFQPRIIE
ncbi:MAG: hypothetical protein ACT4PM_04375 [Gemmatimonadales bacterium]